MSSRPSGSLSHRPPNPLAVWAFDRYCRSQLGKHFATTRIASVSNAAHWDRVVPTLFVANHTSWWDGLLAFVVTRELGLRGHILMDAVSLERYAAFRSAGGVPIRRSSSRAAYDDLQAARSCLQAGAALWIFPQGARRPQAERPEGLGRGAAGLARGHDRPVRVCPVALRYTYLGEQLPEAFAWLGQPRTVGPGEYTSRRQLAPLLEQDLLGALDALDGLLRTESLGAFRTIVAGPLSINKRMDRVRHALGLLHGPFEARNG